MKQLIASIKFLSSVSALPAMWTGRRLQGILWYYACASFLCDMATRFVRDYLNNTSCIFGNIFYLLEIVLIGIYFSMELFSGWTRRLSLLITAALAAGFVIGAISDMHAKINWEYISLAMALYVLFCLAALHKVIRNIEYLKIEHSPLFVFSAAFLLYASYSLVLMLFADYFRQAPVALKGQLWSIHNVLNALKNLAIARMFFLQQKSTAP